MKNNTVFTIHSDGGSRGNPGPAAYGFAVSDETSKNLYSEKGYIGIETNNVAEYTGVIKGLEWIHKNTSPSSVTFILDSELVARQLSGVYKVKNENLKHFYNSAKQLENKIGCPVKYTSVPRRENKVADSLVNEALDAQL